MTIAAITVAILRYTVTIVAPIHHDICEFKKCAIAAYCDCGSNIAPQCMLSSYNNNNNNNNNNNRIEVQVNDLIHNDD